MAAETFGQAEAFIINYESELCKLKMNYIFLNFSNAESLIFK